jgi:esterase/lipase
MASRYDMAKEMFGFPVQKLFFRKNTFNTLNTVKYISQPALILHGNADQVIPFTQGKKVYENYGLENNT